ncbi:MAG: dual specificity protein phosphatase family protein [Desulfurococcaceae archaeon TW002]
MINVVVLDKGVSFGPSPTNTELSRLSKEYTHVVVLTYPHEVKYDVNSLKNFGIEILEVPVPDFRSPPLLDLVFIVEWILDKVAAGGRVYVHCAGGYGRSATVAAAYLIRRYRKNWLESMDRVRKLRKGSLESVEQLSVLRAYDVLLRYLSPVELLKSFKCTDKQTKNHVSKILQIGLKNSETIASLTKIPQNLLIQELFNSVNHYLNSQKLECIFTRLPILCNVNKPVSDDLVSLLKTYAELSIATDEPRNQCVEDLEIRHRENNLVEVVLYCNINLMSSCGVVKKRVENLLSKMCEMLNCSVKTVMLDFLS